MRIIKTEVKVFSFDELNEETKQKALENLYDINVGNEWYQYTFDDAKEIGFDITGFDLDRGAHVTGSVKSILSTLNNIINGHGKDCDTYKLAIRYLDLYNKLVSDLSDGIDTDTVMGENEYTFNDKLSDLEDNFLNELAYAYLLILREEYKYQTSEEAIKEAIEANGYEFTEDGKIY